MNIKTLNSVIYFGEEGWSFLNKSILKSNYTKLFVLVDSNTNNHCLPYFKSNVNFDFNLIVIKNGEKNKNIDTCNEIWKFLTNNGADRKSLMINLGGGVVTDIGGFTASVFKRGIDFINIPTSLLCMVDASVGGKTGIDFNLIKNQLGVFKEPVFTILDAFFLKTLDERQYKSGYSEMLKHGLIAEEKYFFKISSFIKREHVSHHIKKSLEIKSKIVKKDMNEFGFRKILNFGHTLGHAIETYFLLKDPKNALLHGEAISIGMVLESFLSTKYCGFNETDALLIKKTFSNIFPKIEFDKKSINEILNIVKHDKKNLDNNLNFVLLTKIGNSIWDVNVSEKSVLKSFEYYDS